MRALKVPTAGHLHCRSLKDAHNPELHDRSTARRFEAIRNVKVPVIEGALAIEREMEEVIWRYFCGPGFVRGDAFMGLIVKSSWCSYANKRALVRHIVEELGLLETKEGRNLDEGLGKVMDARNAFTHGELSSDGERVWVQFFKNKPDAWELTDERCEKLETLIQTTHKNMEGVVQKIDPGASLAVKPPS